MVSLRGNGATCANDLLCMPDSNGMTSGVQSPMSAQVCINGDVCVLTGSVDGMETHDPNSNSQKSLNLRSALRKLPMTNENMQVE